MNQQSSTMRYQDQAKKLHDILEMHFKAHDYKESQKALVYATEKYAGLTRIGCNQPYIIHPLRMARVAISMELKNDELFSIILLHDVLEETPTTVDDLPFCRTIRTGVETMTFKAPFGQTKDRAKVEYFDNILNNKNAVVCKAIDRFDNLSTMVGCLSEQRIKKNIFETDQLLLPMLKDAKRYYSSISSLLDLLICMIRPLNENLAIFYGVELNGEKRFGGRKFYNNPYQ